MLIFKKGFVVDFGVVSHPQKAIEAVHKILGNPPKSDIIGPVTLEKFGNFKIVQMIIYIQNLNI